MYKKLTQKSILEMIFRSTRASAFLRSFREVALVAADGKLFQHVTQRLIK